MVMKCVCGYEGEDFIEFYDKRRLAIKPHVNIKGIVMEPIGNLDPTYFANVYACPKCDTLKIEVKE